MARFVIFTNERLAGIQPFINRHNTTDNVTEIFCVWDATTNDLGEAAYTHRQISPEDVIIIVPSLFDLLTWDEALSLYVPYFVTREATVAAFARTVHGIVADLMSGPDPRHVIMADMVGADLTRWPLVSADLRTQDWLDDVIPLLNEELYQLNSWFATPSLPLGWRIHIHQRTVDGTLTIHDYRMLDDGHAPGRRQMRRWA